MTKNPVCGMNVDEQKAAASETYYFCSAGRKATFESAPSSYAKR